MLFSSFIISCSYITNEEIIYKIIANDASNDEIFDVSNDTLKYIYNSFLYDSSISDPIYSFALDSRRENIYVGYGNSKGIYKYDLNFENRIEVTTDIRLFDFIIDNNDNLVVSDSDGRRIVIIDSNGSIKKSWRVYNQDNKFIFPGNIEIDYSGNIFVQCLDYNVPGGKQYIQKYDNNGNFLKQIGDKGYDDGSFFSLSNFSIDSKGNIYCCDVGKLNIQVFDNNGVFLKKFGKYGGKEDLFDGELSAITTSNKIFIDTNDLLYISMKGGFKIFTLEGNFVSYFEKVGAENGSIYIKVSEMRFYDNKFYIKDGTQRIQIFTLQ